jgi:hypothetical protein
LDLLKGIAPAKQDFMGSAGLSKAFQWLYELSLDLLFRKLQRSAGAGAPSTTHFYSGISGKFDLQYFQG